VSGLVHQARRQAKKRVDGVTINLPFVSFSVRPDDLEQKVAREIVIRLADKRVLKVFECCDSSVEHALASLREIRSLLVDKQAELSGCSHPTYSRVSAAIGQGIGENGNWENSLTTYRMG